MSGGQKGMNKKEKKSSGRKWAIRGAVLIILLLLLRCGEKPKAVRTGPAVPVPVPAPVEPNTNKEIATPTTTGAPQDVQIAQSTVVEKPDIGKVPAQPEKPTPEVKRLEPPAPEPAATPAAIAPLPQPAEPEEVKEEESPAEEQSALCPGAPTPGKWGAGSEAPAGRIFTDPVTEISFVLVKGGCFNMGSAHGRPDEKPVHEVCVDDFYMGEYEVTQAQYGWVMGHNPSLFQGCDLPVESVSWEDAQVFIRQLNQASGRNYRLPTEAEWEYAARSGSGDNPTSDGKGMSQEYSWYTKSTQKQVYEKRSPNELGLYDMNFNVWEWVSDWYGADYYAKSSRINPTGPQSGSRRVIRAGSGSHEDPQFTKRFGAAPREISDYFGFRLAFQPSSLTEGLTSTQQSGTSNPDRQAN